MKVKQKKLPTLPKFLEYLRKRIDVRTGYSSESVTDSEFLETVGIDGTNIPKWFKNKVAKWLYTEYVSQQEFMDALKYLDEIGILN